MGADLLELGALLPGLPAERERERESSLVHTQRVRRTPVKSHLDRRGPARPPASQAGLKTTMSNASTSIASVKSRLDRRGPARPHASQAGSFTPSESVARQSSHTSIAPGCQPSRQSGGLVHTQRVGHTPVSHTSIALACPPCSPRPACSPSATRQSDWAIARQAGLLALSHAPVRLGNRPRAS